ncbi:myosin-J heavy chain-like isoform X2 [Clytia hemisphaerica]
MSPFYGQIPEVPFASFRTPSINRPYNNGGRFVNTVTGSKRTIPDSKPVVRSRTRGLKKQTNHTLEMIDIPFKAKSPQLLSFHGRTRTNKHAIKNINVIESKHTLNVTTATRKTFVDSLSYRDRFAKHKNITGLGISHKANTITARNTTTIVKAHNNTLTKEPAISGSRLHNDSTFKTGERRFKGKVIDVTVDEADNFETEKDSSIDIEDSHNSPVNKENHSKVIAKRNGTSSAGSFEKNGKASKDIKDKDASLVNTIENSIKVFKSILGKKNMTEDSDNTGEVRSQQAVGNALLQKADSTNTVFDTTEVGSNNVATIAETDSSGDSSELDIVDSDKKTTVNSYASSKNLLIRKKNGTSKPVILVGEDNSFAGHMVTSNSTSMRNETSQTIFPMASHESVGSDQAVAKSTDTYKVDKGKQEKPTIAQTLKDGFNNMAEAAVKLIKGEKQKDEKLTDYLKENAEKGTGDEKGKQQMTGEDIYGAPPSVNVKIVNPKSPHAISNDILKGDWFETAHEPSQKTKNDIKMSSDVLGRIANIKMKGKRPEDPQLQTPLESKNQYENRVKKITNLAESTENDILSNLIQDSLGNAMSDRKPLKLKNEKTNKSPEKTDVSEIQKLLSKYNDDFDVFVDKAVSNHLGSPLGPAVGQVVSKINTMDTLPDNEKDDGVTEFDSVTGTKKHFKGSGGHHHHQTGNITLIDSNQDDDDDTLMRRLAQKWKMFKESSKGMLEDSKKKLAIEENQSQKSKVVDSGNKKGSDVLKQYFDQVEQKQALNQSKDLEDRQAKRRERLKSTLHMITDIEGEIDRLVNKETAEARHFDDLKQKKDHKLKGKANIFKELTSSDDSTPKEDVHEDSLSKVVEHFASNEPKADVGDDLVTNQESAAASPTITGTADPVEVSEVDDDEVDKSKEPQNFVATPQYEEEETEPKESSRVHAKHAEPIELVEQSQPQQFLRITHHQQRPQIQEENIESKPVSLFEKVPQQDIEEKQLIKSITTTPGNGGSSNGKTIENTISSSDQNEHLEQAAFMKQFQQDELKGDMARVKEATQNGLRDMFNTAVQKQNNFITNVEGGPPDQDGGSPPQSQLGEPHTLVAMPDPAETEDTNTEGVTTPENIAGDPQSMFGAPSRWQEASEGNDEPFNMIKDDIPETDSAGEGMAARKSNIMRLVQSDDADTDDSDDDNDNDDDDDESNNTEGAAMFMALPIAMPT